MVGVNILDKLKVELNSDDKIEKFVKDAVNSARSFVQFNPEEKGKIIAGTSPAMQTMVQLALPKAESDSTQAFKNKLIDAFVQNVPGFTPSPDADLSENYKPNQIVVVCANSGFPLRFLENMKTLKDKYDRLLASPEKALNKMVLHTESFEKPLPPLFEMDSREILENVKKPLLLAFALQLITPQQNPVTGEKFYAMNIPDDFSDVNWVPLSKDFAGCLDVLAHDFKKYQMLSSQVEKELQKQRDAMKKGDKVITAGGIYGEIKEVQETSLLITIAKDVTIKVDKGSVYASAEDAQQSGKEAVAEKK